MARPIPITKDSSAPGFGGRFFCTAEGHLDWHNQLCLCFFSLLCLNFDRVQFQQIKTHRSLSSRSFGPKFCTIRHLQLFRLIAAFLGNRFSHVNPWVVVGIQLSPCINSFLSTGKDAKNVTDTKSLKVNFPEFFLIETCSTRSSSWGQIHENACLQIFNDGF